MGAKKREGGRGNFVSLLHLLFQCSSPRCSFEGFFFSIKRLWGFRQRAACSCSSWPSSLENQETASDFSIIYQTKQYMLYSCYSLSFYIILEAVHFIHAFWLLKSH
jgi:hypothetical protein